MSTTNQSGAEAVGLVTSRRPWSQILWTAGVFLALSLFLAIFYKQTFVGLIDRHSMDVAQVARNVASGEGFTTNLVRPFNVALLGEQHLRNRELNTAPAFPFAVAAVFKLRSPSDQCVVWVSMLFLLLTVVATYLLGMLLFNWRAGLLSAAALGTSAAPLRAGASGTEWPMAAFLFTALLLVIAVHHRSQAGQRRLAGAFSALASGVLIALLYMTHHILLFLVVPVAVYFGVTGDRRKANLIAFLVTVLLASAPWAYSNFVYARGSILGANAWEIMKHTTAFPGDVLYRTTDSANLSVLRAILFPVEHFGDFAAKLMTGSSEVTQALLGVLGLAILPFAFVSMLYRFKVPSANALRGFVYGAGVLLIISIALFSIDLRAVLMLAPPIAVFGSAYFYLLLEAKRLHPIYARAVVAGVVLITCWPALGSAIWKTNLAEDRKTLAATIILRDSFSSYVYTDVPWAIAWRTSGAGVWLPCEDEDVYYLASRGLPLHSAILTPECDSYPQDDTWHMLHRFQFWRDYLHDPAAPAFKAQVSKIAAKPDLTVERVERELRERKRQLPIYDSISGCTSERFHGLAPDDYIVVTCRPR